MALAAGRNGSRRSLGADLARVSGGESPPLAELLAARDALQAELEAREDSLQRAQRAMWESQSTAAAAVRADAEAALEQANRQVRSLANAVKAAVKGQDAAQAEQRAAVVRARAAEEEAASLRAEVQLLRGKVAKLTRPAPPEATNTRIAAPTSERATVSRLQREMELLRATAGRTSREEKRASSSAVVAPADPALCVLVQELARAEAAARAQLAASHDENRMLRERLDGIERSLAASQEKSTAMARALGLGLYNFQAETPGAEVTLAQLAAPDSYSMRPGAVLQTAETEDPVAERMHDDEHAPFETSAVEAEALPLPHDAALHEAYASAALLSESLAALANTPPEMPSSTVALLTGAGDDAGNAVISPAELSDDDIEDDSEVGPDDVARAQAALELAEAEAAQLVHAEKSLRQQQEQAESDYAYASEVVQRALAAVSDADAALASTSSSHPALLHDLSVARTHALQEATRAQESARVAASSVRAAAAAAAASAESAAVARATVTAKAFTAARLAAADRRNADFRAKLSAVQAQTSALAKQLQAESTACSRVRTEATALMAVLSASGRPELVEDSTSRAVAELESISDDEDTAETPAQQLKGWQERIHSAARERDRMTNRLAAERARKRAAESLVSVLSERLEVPHSSPSLLWLALTLKYALRRCLRRHTPVQVARGGRRSRRRRRRNRRCWTACGGEISLFAIIAWVQAARTSRL